MKYLFNIHDPYVVLNNSVDVSPVQIDPTIYVDIILNYTKFAIVKWYYGAYDDEARVLFDTALSLYLSPHRAEQYLNYLNNVYWQTLNRNIPEILGPNQTISIDVKSSGEFTLILTVTGILSSPIDEYERTLERAFSQVSDKLYEGGYVDPLLLEVYNAHQAMKTKGEDDG